MIFKFNASKLVQGSMIGATLLALTSASPLAVNAQDSKTTPLDIVKSTYEGETSEGNGRNL